MMPPETPEPTTTKSTCVLGLNFVMALTFLCRQLVALAIVVAEGRRIVELAFETNQIPADLSLVPAVLGIRQQPGDGVGPDLHEKWSFFDGLQHLNLLRRVQGAKLSAARKECDRLSLQGSETFGVDRLLSFVEGSQRTVDEIQAPGFARSRRVIGGNDLCGDAFDFRALLGR